MFYMNELDLTGLAQQAIDDGCRINLEELAEGITGINIVRDENFKQRVMIRLTGSSEWRLMSGDLQIRTNHATHE